MKRAFATAILAAFVLVPIAAGCAKKDKGAGGGAEGSVPAEAKAQMNEMYKKGGAPAAK